MGEEKKTIAEEIEASLIVDRKIKKETTVLKDVERSVSNFVSEEGESRRPSISELDKKIKKMEEAIKVAVNPIIKKRFTDSLEKLLEQKKKSGS